VNDGFQYQCGQSERHIAPRMLRSCSVILASCQSVRHGDGFPLCWDGEMHAYGPCPDRTPCPFRLCRIVGADQLGDAPSYLHTTPLTRVAYTLSPVNCGRRHLSAIHTRQASCRLTYVPNELPTIQEPAPFSLHTMSPSNIRVFVQWKNATVFAGEDVECTITFKNVAVPEGRDRSPVRKQNGFAPGGERQRKLPPVHSSTRPTVSRNSSYTTAQKPPPNLRGHRPALSLNTPSSVGGPRSPVPASGAFGNNMGGKAHGRSLSIMSLGTDAATETSRDRGPTPARPIRGHARSGSLQIVPGRQSSHPGTTSAIGMPSELIVLQPIHQVIDQPHTPHLLLEDSPPHQQPRTTRANSPFQHGPVGEDRVLRPRRAHRNCLLPHEKRPTPSLKASSSPQHLRMGRRPLPNDRAWQAIRQWQQRRTDDLPHDYTMITERRQQTPWLTRCHR
jgi:hypothetical protein